MEKILLYGLNKERETAIVNLLKTAGFEEVICLKKQDSHYLAGYLHGLSEYEQKICTPKEEAHDAEFMMISGFDREGINRLFDVFKSSGSARPVTSALTEINKDWVLADIINEVYEEHLMLTGRKNNKA